MRVSGNVDVKIRHERRTHEMTKFTRMKVSRTEPELAAVVLGLLIVVVGVACGRSACKLLTGVALYTVAVWSGMLNV
jgi:hypothetical protein